ncbi:hypothetical protein V4S38_04145 [Enterococcus cecorum]
MDKDITASNIKKAKHLGTRVGLNIKWQNLTYEKVAQAKVSWFTGWCLDCSRKSILANGTNGCGLYHNR